MAGGKGAEIRAKKNTTLAGATKTPPDGLFMPSCFEHTGDLCMKGGPRVRGVGFAESLGDWVFGRGAAPAQLVDDCAPAGSDPCNPSCSC